MDIIEAMKARRSVRNYVGAPLTSEEEAQIQKSIDNATDPFGGSYALTLTKSDLTEFKPSTYGVIKGAKNYLLLGIGAQKRDWLSAGFAMEQVVLRAEQLGLGTCWIAGTFKSGDFEAAAQFPTETPLKVVSPVGVASDKGSIMNSIARALARSDKRKPFDTLFFSQNFNTPLPTDGPFAEALEMLRVAPSSTNSQPWRALVTGNKVDFYITSDASIHFLNLGIGLCHFALVCDVNKVTGAFIHNNMPQDAPEGWVYVTTFVEV